MNIHEERPEDELTGAAASEAFARAMARTAPRHPFTPAGIAAAVDEAIVDAVLATTGPLEAGGPIVAHLLDWDFVAIARKGTHAATGCERLVITLPAAWYARLDPGDWIAIGSRSYGLRTTARVLGAHFIGADLIELTALMPGGAR